MEIKATIKTIMKTILIVDAAVGMDAALVGDPNTDEDVDADAHQLRPLQIISGTMGIAHTVVKNVLTLPTETRVM